MLIIEQKDIEDKLVSDPPILPPIFKDRGRRRRDEYIIIPDIAAVETRSITIHDNCKTIHYVWMLRVWGAFERIELAHVNTRAYRQWLDVYPRENMPHDIPPHISFGGAVESIPGGDPTFYARWVEYVRKTFVC